MRTNRLLNRDCRGMSLIEMVVVMAILSVVMMAVMSLYIPAHRSTVVQNQVTDIQGNLLLAMDRLSHDLLTAGFVVTGQPIIFDTASPTYNSTTLTDPKDFTIRTRLTGRGFGRVDSVAAGAGGAEVSLTLTSADMVADLPVNSKVRLVEPVSATECNEDSEPDEAKRVYTVIAASGSVLDLDDPNGGLTAGVVNPETVIVRVADASQPSIQTVRYQHADGDGDGIPESLVRIVNGVTQYLARNVSDVDFTYTNAASGRVQRVDIKLEGKTQELVGNEAISGEKTRSLKSSVTLRNVF